jgi:hypothetical protein
VRDSGPVVAAGAIEGFPNLYRRGNCPASYEALSTVEPPKVEAQQYFPEPQGFSADGSKAIFRVNDNLTPAAPAQPPSCEAEGKGCHYRTYEASGGTLSLLCILPDGTPFAGDCSAGSPPTFHKNRTAGVSHAISADGSVVYWSATEPDPDHPETTNPATEPGRIYARLNGSSTVKVSETQTTKPARFWGAAADGSKALFEVEDPAESPTAKNKNLYLYDLGEEASALIATKVIGVAAQSEDLSRIYYVSEAASEEEEEEGALPGRPNLYLWEAGTGESGFIATLSARDAIGTERYSDVTPEAVFHAAQATPDGSRLAFISVNPLTGFDNTDAQSGEADSEVFSYDAETKALSCASCSPVGVSPVGRIIEAPGSGGRLPTAASLPVGENQLYTPRALSADANHLLFTSYTDLLPTDTNAKADVYEWEAAGTEPGCESEADPDYYAANGGCLHLISSGSSEEDSELVDSSPSGKDVFLSTEQSLLPQDPGLIDIYDAREGGGFPARAAAPTPCAGEACQGQASPPPAFQGPASSTPGPGNPPAHKKPPRCPKGKHRVSKNGKSSCAKDKSHEKQRQAKHERKGRG